MTITKRIALGAIALALTAAGGFNATADDAPAVETTAAPSSVLDFTMNSIDGDAVPLQKYAGKVALIVNVASKCGLTKQYTQLTEIHEKYKDKGFVILGFPANNFMKQEPGSDAEIKLFCQQEYQVEFDMFSKISVKGDDIHPLYQFLTSEDTNKEFAGDINWNFEKFLMNGDGEIVARFAPKTKPDAPEVIAAIEAELAKTAEEAPAA